MRGWVGQAGCKYPQRVGGPEGLPPSTDPWCHTRPEHSVEGVVVSCLQLVVHKGRPEGSQHMESLLLSLSPTAAHRMTTCDMGNQHIANCVSYQNQLSLGFFYRLRLTLICAYSTNTTTLPDKNFLQYKINILPPSEWAHQYVHVLLWHAHTSLLHACEVYVSQLTHLHMSSLIH